MALHVPQGQGFASMLKDGSKSYRGVDETVMRNIEAVQTLVKLVKTSYGPNGLNKIVINRIMKQFVTNDAATIIKEIENDHPGVKLLILASQKQEEEVGDGTNFVLLLSGLLLEEAGNLLNMGLSVSDIVDGYEAAAKLALAHLPKLVIKDNVNVRDKPAVERAIKASVMSKQFGNEVFLSELIAEACTSLLKEDDLQFDVSNVRVCKILGGGTLDSRVVKGMVFRRNAEGMIKKVENAKVAVYSCAMDISQTETKGTILIKSAEQLKSYSSQDDKLLEDHIKAIKDSGATVIVAGGKFGDLALHYINKYGIMAVRLMSKWDVRRIAKACNAIVLNKPLPPNEVEMGVCDHVYADEIGEDPVVVFKQDNKMGAISTIVIRGATQNVADDVERAIDDGVNNFRILTKDARLLAGAGGFELEMAKYLKQQAEKCSGLKQYSMNKFGVALEMIMKQLSENSGQPSTEVLTRLNALHQEGKSTLGVNVSDETGKSNIDAKADEIFDLYMVKEWGIKLAVDAACTLLRVNQIVMAKAAGGPKAPQQNKHWDEDE